MTDQVFSMKKYVCRNCNRERVFFPYFYKYRIKTHPKSCHLCNMPKRQAFKYITLNEGLWEAIKFSIRNRICN